MPTLLLSMYATAALVMRAMRCGAGTGDEGTLRVTWPSAPAELTALSPRVVYEVDGGSHLLPASSPLVRRGMLDLADEAMYGMATIDIDGAVGRLRDAARTAGEGRRRGLEARLDATADSSDGPAALPALRSAGITLLKRDRENGAALHPAFEEEGHLKTGAAVRVGETGLRADEVIAMDSWSLGVRARLGARGGATRARAALPFEFDAEFDVPDGSLLPLRFGRDYLLRARVADIAGGGLSPQDADDAASTGPIAYSRHQPVAPPTVELGEGISPADLGPGGDIARLVIRSDAPDYLRNDRRVIAAPTTTLELAEQHSALDPIGAQTPEQHFGRICGVLSGPVPDPAAEGVSVFPVPGPAMENARAAARVAG